MEAILLGCGEAFDEDLPNTSVLLKFSSTLLLDCGFSVPPQVWRAVPDANTIDAVYISHAHADHYFGLPALLGRMWEDGRTKPLSLISQAAVLDQIREALELGYRGLPARFRYSIEQQAVAPGQTLRIGDASLDFAHTSHPSPNLAIRIEAEGKKVCYSGDGMFTDASRRLFCGADLLIHEAYSFERIPVHADIGRLIEMAEQEGVRRLALVHVQRDLRRNPERILRAIQRKPHFDLPEPASRIEI